MEVHAHTHTPDSHREKKWTHYLWEFLMLFLAVFCGFLAENLRENRVEHKRTLLYANQFLEEIKLVCYSQYVTNLISKNDAIQLITK